MYLTHLQSPIMFYNVKIYYLSYDVLSLLYIIIYMVKGGSFESPNRIEALPD